MTMNLVQVQQALQTMPMKNIMDYANGVDPTVPSYMALAELNRRKMIQDNQTAAANIPQQTVKQSLENAITKPNQLTVNPAVPQQQQVNPAAPQQQVNPAKNQSPNQLDPTVNEQNFINPAAPQPHAQPFKHGGLASLPVHMFKQRNFAPGGIVAFDDGGFTSTRQQALDALNQAMPDKQGNQSMTDYLSNPENRQYLNDRQTAYNAIVNNTLTPITPDAAKAYQTTYHRMPSNAEIMQPVVNPNVPASSSTTEAPSAAPSVNAPANAAPAGSSTTPASTAAPVARPPVANPNVARPTGGIPSAPSVGNVGDQIMGVFNKLKANTADYYKMPDELKTKPDKALNDYYKEIQDVYKIAGVSQDPLQETRERYKKIEDRQNAEHDDDAFNRLITQASAFATADPSKGIGYAAALSANASQALQKEQNALREQQQMAMAKLYSEFDKEDDARKRGDAKGVLEAKQKQQEHNDKLLELQDKFVTAANGHAQADAQLGQVAGQLFVDSYKPYEAQTSRIAATRPTGAVDYDRMISDPNYANVVLSYRNAGFQGKTDDEFRKEYENDILKRKEWESKGGVDAYIAEQRRRIGNTGGLGGGAPATATSTRNGVPMVRSQVDGKDYEQTKVVGNVTLHFNPQTGRYQ